MHIKPYKFTTHGILSKVEQVRIVNDLHMNSTIYLVRLTNQNETFLFVSKNWDETLQKGDRVNLVAQQDLLSLWSNGHLQGVRITRHK
jgi:hypothetical protein